MNLESPIKAWRKRNRLTKPQAIAVLGLSLGGYNKQVSGDRPVSQQTLRLMACFDRMTDEQRQAVLRELEMTE